MVDELMEKPMPVDSRGVVKSGDLEVMSGSGSGAPQMQIRAGGLGSTSTTVRSAVGDRRWPHSGVLLK